MKVRVTKANGESYWYKNNIGGIFEVDGLVYYDGSYKVIGDSKQWLKENDSNYASEWYIDINDCEEVKRMTKEDLRTGDLVQLENKDWYIVVKNGTKEVYYSDTDILLRYKDGCFIGLSAYGDKLDYNSKFCNEYNIVKVAETECTRVTFTAFKSGKPIDEINGFKIIWSRETEEQIKLKQEIEELKRQLAEKEKELNNL